MRHILFILIALSFLLRPLESHDHSHDEGPPGSCCPHALVRRDDDDCHKEKTDDH